MAQPLALLVVVGPTASGKTGLGIELARALGGEVISADSMQIYQDLSIATARPTEAEQQKIPHHMMGFLPPEQDYSVARFVADAGAVIADVTARGRLPVLVGGTGLYVSALLDGLQFVDAPGDAALRDQLRRRAEQEGVEATHQRLAAVDPEYAAGLHPNNLGRVLRALELFELSGVTMTEQRARSRRAGSPYAPVVLGLDFMERDRLYERINLRVEQMLEQGLLDEAKDFYRRHPNARTAAQAIGCKELRPHLLGLEPLEACVERLKRETRRYAKRQLTWFRRDGRVHWLYRDAPGPTDLLGAALAHWRAHIPLEKEDIR